MTVYLSSSFGLALSQTMCSLAGCRHELFCIGGARDGEWREGGGGRGGGGDEETLVQIQILGQDGEVSGRISPSQSSTGCKPLAPQPSYPPEHDVCEPDVIYAGMHDFPAGIVSFVTHCCRFLFIRYFIH